MRLSLPRWRALLLAGAAAAAALSVSVGLARSQASAAPATALSAWPLDARARAARAQRLIDADPSAADLAAAVADARAALARDLTVSSAVATLGAVADVNGRAGEAKALMTAADRLSRRDLLPRLWLIEERVNAGDVAGALRHFDVALRTSPAARRILFPVLTGALADRQVQPAIARLLANGNNWAGEFVYFAATQAGSAEPLARTVSAMPRVPDYPGTDLRALIVETLVAQRNLAAARRLGLGALPPAARGATVVDPQFASDAAPPPVNWQLNVDGGVVAERSTDLNGAPELAVSAPAGLGGIAASQVLALAPGRYRLVSEQPRDARAVAQPARWTVTCVGSVDRPIGSLSLAAPAPRTTGAFSVPASDCPGQWLRLEIGGAAARGPIDLRIARVAVEPL